MPNFGPLVLDGDTADGSVHPYAAEDILYEGPLSRGKSLIKRGKVLFQSNFERDYSGFEGVFNAKGEENLRQPLSLVNFPRPGIRMAAAGPSVSTVTSTDAIRRLSRPIRWEPGMPGIPFSISFKYARVFDTVTGGMVDSVLWTSVLRSFSFGVDTQGRSDRGFFAIRAVPSADLNAETYELRGARNSSGSAIEWVPVPADRGASGLLTGPNEGKPNEGYARLSGTYGVNRYLEAQIGGKVIDLRDLVPDVREPMQFSTTDVMVNFGDGFNFIADAAIRATDNASILAAGFIISEVLVTFGDEVNGL